MCCMIDNIFLMLMTGICILIMYVDLMVLEKMFEEYFLLKHYLDENTYNSCYSPQTIMRITFECYAIYCAACCTVLTCVLAFNVSDEVIKWVTGKVINIEGEGPNKKATVFFNGIGNKQLLLKFARLEIMK